MKDYKTIRAESNTIRAEINGFYNKKKNLNEIKRLEESLKEVKNYLNDPEISDDVLLELHKNFKHDIPSLNLTMISFFASCFSGLYGLLGIGQSVDLFSQITAVIILVVISFFIPFGIFKIIKKFQTHKALYFDPMVAELISKRLNKSFVK